MARAITAIFLLCLTVSAEQLHLAWDPSGSNLSYQVYFGIAHLEYTNCTFVGPLTNFVLQPLATTNYFIAITAMDTNGIEGNFSPELMARATLSPGPKTNVIVETFHSTNDVSGPWVLVSAVTNPITQPLGFWKTQIRTTNQ